MQSGLVCKGSAAAAYFITSLNCASTLFVLQIPQQNLQQFVSYEKKRKLTNFGSIVAPTDRHSLLKSNFEVNLQTSD